MHSEAAVTPTAGLFARQRCAQAVRLRQDQQSSRLGPAAALQPAQAKRPDSRGQLEQKVSSRTRLSGEQRAAAGQVLFAKHADVGLMGSSLLEPPQPGRQPHAAEGASAASSLSGRASSEPQLQAAGATAGDVLREQNAVQGSQGSVHHLGKLLSLESGGRAHDQVPAGRQASLASLVQVLKRNSSALEQVSAADLFNPSGGCTACRYEGLRGSCSM